MECNCCVGIPAGKVGFFLAADCEPQTVSRRLGQTITDWPQSGARRADGAPTGAAGERLESECFVSAALWRANLLHFLRLENGDSRSTVRPSCWPATWTDNKWRPLAAASLNLISSAPISQPGGLQLALIVQRRVKEMERQQNSETAKEQNRQRRRDSEPDRQTQRRRENGSPSGRESLWRRSE